MRTIQVPSQNKIPSKPLDLFARMYIECGIDIPFRIVPADIHRDEEYVTVPLSPVRFPWRM